METNEQMKTAMRTAIQAELDRFFVRMQDLREGDLEYLEEQVIKASQQMGRSLLEGMLNSQLHERRPVARASADIASGWWENGPSNC